MGNKYLIKKFIENREAVNSTDTDHTKIKIITEKKSTGKYISYKK